MADVENFQALVYQQTAAVAAEAHNALLTEVTATRFDVAAVQPAPPAAPIEAPAAPGGAGNAPAPENVVARAMGPGPGGAVSGPNDAAEAPEVPQVITTGDNAFRLTRFQGAEQIQLGANGPTLTLLPNGGYETDQAVRVTPVNQVNDQMIKKPRIFMGGGGGETQYSFRGGQWVIADAQGVTRFFDGRNEYMVSPAANNPGGPRNQVFQRVTPR